MVNRLALTLLASTLWSISVWAADGGVEEVERCVRSNLPEQTARQRVTVECEDRTGGTWVQEASLYWRRSDKGRSETLVEIEEPPEDSGVRYLWHWYEQEKRSETWGPPDIITSGAIETRIAEVSLQEGTFHRGDSMYWATKSGGEELTPCC